MTRAESAKNLRILKNVAIIFVCMIGFLLMGNIFINFSDKLEDELNESAAAGIEETYKEVGQLISSISDSRINYLEMLGYYLELVDIKDEDLVTVISEYERICGFTQFYFLNEDGNFITVDGTNGYIDLGRNISMIGKDVTSSLIVDGSLPSKDEMIFYISNCVDGTYNGFHYKAIAFGYDKQDMINSLKIDSYNGEGISYITYSSGKIICRLDDQTVASNVFTILDYSLISDEDYEKILEDFENKRSGTYKISGNGEGNFVRDYYFSYQTLKNDVWILVSLVPVDVANKTINQIRTQTTSIIIGTFGGIFVLLLLAVTASFRNSIKNKDGLLLQRNIVFDLACNNLNEIYILFNIKRNYIDYVSPNAERLLGISSEDIYEDGSLVSIKLKDKEYNLSNLINEFIKKELYEYADEVYVGLNNSNKKTLYSLSLYRQANSLYGIIVLSDRTEENRIRQELQDALDGAKSANNAKSIFLSNVSHDMRTPMNAIIGFANLIEKDPNNASKVMEYVSKIKLSSNHLLNLINEVLDYSKVEANKTTLNIESTDIEKVVNSVDSIIRPQAIEKNQTFNLTTHFDKKCNVLADEFRITQILINVLSNAIKYTPNGGEINFDLSSKKYHNYIQYTFIIKDNGLGMSEEFVNRIFEPFSREESSVTNKIQGTGLGMAITKNLVDLMGGTISVKSKKNEGSTFTIILHFELDQNADQTMKLETKEINEQLYSIEGLNILAAEDNELNSEIIKALIALENATITVCENGKECLDTFVNSKENEYDAILMDVQMPIMDGYEATFNIRNSSHPKAKTIPIIAMTANAFIDDVNNSLKSGMDGHVAKPIDMGLLKKTIVESINKYKNAS